MLPGSTVRTSFAYLVAALVCSGALLMLASVFLPGIFGDGREVLTAPSTVVMENNEGVWLRAPLATPAAGESDLHFRSNPATDLGVFQWNYDGTMLPVEVHRRELSFIDPATNQLNLLSLLYFDVSGKRIWTTGPDSDGLELRFSPQVSYQAVFASDGGLYFVDAQDAAVIPIGDHLSRRDAWLRADGRVASSLLDWATSPVWSPDGSKVIYSSSRSGTPSLWIYDFEHSLERLIYVGKGPPLSVMSWAKDDQVLFELLPMPGGAGQGTIQRLNLSRREVVTLAVGEPLSLTLDNQRLLYAREEQSGLSFYEQGVEGGAPRLMAMLEDARLERPVQSDLSHDGRVLTVAARLGSAVRLVDLELETGRLSDRRVNASGKVSALVSTPGGTFTSVVTGSTSGGTLLFPPNH